jgi:hypothetical protein
MTHAIFDMDILVAPTSFYRGILKLIDQSEHYGGLSITNDAEHVVAEAADKISRETPYQIGDFIVVYQDSDGQWDGIGVKNGKFDDFVMLKTRDLREACYRMNDAVLGMR